MTYLMRYDARRDLAPADYEAMIHLVRDLGHDPGDIAEQFAVTASATGVRLHLTEHLRDESGTKYADVAADRPASRPHVHDIDPQRLPEAIRPPAQVAPKGAHPMTDDRLREIAADLMTTRARDIDALDIAEHADDDDLTAADIDTIGDLIATATITITWSTDGRD